MLDSSDKKFDTEEVSVLHDVLHTRKGENARWSSEASWSTWDFEFTKSILFNTMMESTLISSFRIEYSFKFVFADSISYVSSTTMRSWQDSSFSFAKSTPIDSTVSSVSRSPAVSNTLTG